MLARLATAGPCPLTLVEDISADREWAPRHSHPWDELTDVLEGEMEFTVGTETRGGGPGTLVSLPGACPISCGCRGDGAVPDADRRRPSLDFLREVGEVYAAGPTLEWLVEVAGRHGVRPAFELTGE